MHILQSRVNLLLGNLDLAIIDSLDDVVRWLAVDGATDRLACTEDLLDTTSEVLGERFVGEFTGNLSVSTLSCTAARSAIKLTS